MQPRQTTSIGVIIISVIVGIIIGYILAGYVLNQSEIDEVRQNTSEETQTTEGRIEGNVNSELVEGDANETAFTIAMSNLDPTQEAAARAAGVEGDTIVVTNGMVVCAEGEVGASRLVEIQNGARLSIGEGLTYINCYRDNR